MNVMKYLATNDSFLSLFASGTNGNCRAKPSNSFANNYFWFLKSIGSTKKGKYVWYNFNTRCFRNFSYFLNGPISLILNSGWNLFPKLMFYFGTKTSEELQILSGKIAIRDEVLYHRPDFIPLYISSEWRGDEPRPTKRKSKYP